MLQENNPNLEKNIGDESSKIKNKTIIFLAVIFFIIASSASAYYVFVNKINQDKAIIDNVALNQQKESSNKEVEQQGNKLFSFNLIKPVFAELAEIKNIIKPILSQTKIEKEKIENLNSFEEKENIKFTQSQLKALEDYGFFLAQNDIIKDQKLGTNDFVDMYNDFDGSSNKYYREPQDTVFITSDVALHLYHILIDRSFQKIEETKFQPMLRAMTEALFLDSINNYNSATGPELKESYKRLSAYYLIPLIILDTGNKSAEINLDPKNYSTFAQYLDAISAEKIKNSKEKLEFSLNSKIYKNIELSDEIYNLAKQELELINNAKGIASSPVFTPLRPEFINDYSQFKPRSHYTKNDILKSYFIAMMWYGRMGFTLNSPELTRDALIITGQVNNVKINDKNLSELWSDMAVVIDFFVGEVDDLTPYQYTEVIKKIYGEEMTDQELIDNELLNNFIKTAVEELPQPKILSEVILMEGYDSETKESLLASTMQFRFMGQRFTPDAYILNKLTQGDEAPDSETGQKLPSIPTALMPISLLNSNNQLVKHYLDEWINDPARIESQKRPFFDGRSDKVIAKFYNQLNNEFSAYDNKVWTQNIYWSWLNCFKPLLSDYGNGYPFFMANQEWQKKNLGTVLGSYTELKHDTLLYAKQSYAELGGGGDNPDELPPVVKGYVEPDLIFWNRIITLAETTEKGLTSRNIFPNEFKRKYQIFLESSKFFKEIVEQELQNQEISDDDFEKLRTISSKFATIVAPLSGQELTIKERRAGIIADIHTDAVQGQILYEATGKPYIIYVAVDDINGARLTRGVVFNHYEFTNPLSERLSDEDWQAKVYDGKSDLPDEDKWSKELIK